MLVFRRFRLIAAILALMLVASACGGDDSGGDAATTTTTASGSGDGAADATTTTTEAEPVSGDSGSTYCDRIRAAQDGSEDGLDFNLLGKSPDEIKALFETNLRVFEDWRDLAPNEIQDDADVLLDAFRTIVERGNELDWDLETLVDDPVFNAFDDAAVTAASNNLDAYSKDVCGVDLNTLADPGAGPPPPDDAGDDPIAIALNAFSLPADLLSEDNIECLRDEVGPEFEAGIEPGWTPSAEEVTVLIAALDTCGITLG